MGAYVGFVMLLSFSVYFLLLMGAGKLCGFTPGVKNTIAAAAAGSFYSGICLLPMADWIFAEPIRLAVLFLIAFLSIGLQFQTIAAFVLTTIVLDGITGGMENCGVWSMVIAGACVLLLCVFPRNENKDYIKMELHHNGKTMRILAFRDTGNTLRDPVTGETVLVVSPEVAETLVGLNRSQIADPIGSVTMVPGLRLVPYRTVGKNHGLMLAIRLKDVRVGNRSQSRIVAFAPDGFCSSKFQALTGR